MSMQPPEDPGDQIPPAFTGTPSRPIGQSNTNWGRRTGPLSRSLAEPPDLRRYSTTPRYDMTTLADLVGVRAVMIWTWEQNLGITTADETATSGLRYSERDMIALMWLRDQVVAGKDPGAAALKLREALQAANAPDAASSVPPAAPAQSYPPAPAQSHPPTPAQSYPPAQTAPSNPPAQSYPPPGQSYPPATSILPAQSHPSQPAPMLPLPSMPLRQPSRPTSTRGLRGPNDPPSQPISRLGASKPLQDAVSARSVPIGTRTPTQSVIAGPQTWVSAAPNRDLRMMIQPMLQAFTRLDVHAAKRALDDALLNQNNTLEHVATSLLMPVIARINELWVRKEEILPQGVFAINVLRSRLFYLFDQLNESRDAPLTFIAAGPSEPHDLEALLLALFWRRTGLRVVYFGHEITAQSFLQEMRTHRPRIAALTLSSTQRIRLVTHVAHEVDKMEMPRPSFCLVGAPLARNADLQRKTGGIYLGVDATEATHYVRQVLRM